MTHKQHDSPEGMIQREDLAIRVFRVYNFTSESEYSW
jgi:hypothetical protein